MNRLLARRLAAGVLTAACACASAVAIEPDIAAVRVQRQELTYTPPGGYPLHVTIAVVTIAGSNLLGAGGTTVNVGGTEIPLEPSPRATQTAEQLVYVCTTFCLDRMARRLKVSTFDVDGSPLGVSTFDLPPGNRW